jgi:putative ABC transport system permease protein
MSADLNRTSWFDSLWSDVRGAGRMLRHSPGFSAIVILTLALGIGANTAIFSVVNSLLLRTLPVANPEQLVLVSSTTAVARGGNATWTYATWEQIRLRAGTFGGAFAASLQRFNLAQAGEVQPADGLVASGDYFTTLGVPALMGRTFTAVDDVRGGGPDGPVTVISYGFWQRRFAGAANVIGSSLRIDHVPFTVIGVMPPDFHGVEVGRTFDVAIPIGAEPLIRGKSTLLDVRGRSWLSVMLRLKPEQSIEAATAALRGAQPGVQDGAVLQAEQAFLKEPFALVSAASGTSELCRRYERPLMAMLMIVVTILLIACANIGNLLLARATARDQEVSVRRALGASGWRLAQQLFIESLVLAGLGAAVGLLLATWGSRALVAQLSSGLNVVALDVSLDWRVMAFTAAIAIVTGLLFGTAPALRAARVSPIGAMNERGRGPAGVRGGFSYGFVITQVALSLVLVIAAGLLVRTFQQLMAVPLGFESERVLLVNVNTVRAQVEPAQRTALFQRLVDAVASAPGVERAAGSITTPVGSMGMSNVVDVPGAPVMSQTARSVVMNVVTPNWFATYGTVIRVGRDIGPADTAGAPPVAVVNEAFVRRFLAGRQAVGATFTGLAFGPGKAPPVPKTIIGVTADAVARSLRDEIQPTIYLPLAQMDLPPAMAEITVSVRGPAGSRVSLGPAVVAALADVDRNLAFTFRPLAEQVNASLTEERLLAALSAVFGALALVLAGVGLYGMTAYSVGLRQGEIGIRMALGAPRTSVVALVLRQSFTMTLIGIALGLAGAAFATRYLDRLIFGVTPLDSVTFVLVPLTLAGVAAVAAFVPARRAATTDPMTALRRD